MSVGRPLLRDRGIVRRFQWLCVCVRGQRKQCEGEVSQWLCAHHVGEIEGGGSLCACHCAGWTRDVTLVASSKALEVLGQVDHFPGSIFVAGRYLQH